jgi:hypothetical protein
MRLLLAKFGSAATSWSPLSAASGATPLTGVLSSLPFLITRRRPMSFSVTRSSPVGRNAIPHGLASPPATCTTLNRAFWLL